MTMDGIYSGVSCSIHELKKEIIEWLNLLKLVILGTRRKQIMEKR